MFDSLSNRFEGIFKRMRGLGTLRESDVDEVLREIRLALLEADVNLHVVRGFQERIRERCVGAEVHRALNPVQQVIKFVHEELIATLGGETLEISHPAKPPTVVLLAGLQGAGKTTNAAKLASWFKQQGRNPMLVGADLQRPAAVEQLRTLGASIGVPVFSEPSDPVAVARRGVAEAVESSRDVVICDTAGRLAIDEEMMDQVGRIAEAIEPHYTFLVVDAMTGQDAVTTAEAFHAVLELDGVILTKVDGDARGGAALSVKEVVGRPIAFSSTGERIDEFELFHPDRVASRILGMGDVLTLVEKAEQVYEEAEAEAAAAKLLEGEFTLEDFLEQMRQLKKMGSLQNLVGMLPGVPPEVRKAEIEDDRIAQVEAIICSMTPEERTTPRIVDGSRRQRIAAGSGSRPSEVSQLLRQFSEVQRMMKRMGGKGPGSGRKKPKKGRKGSRVTPPGGQQKKPGKPKLTLPGLEDGQFDLSSLR